MDVTVVGEVYGYDCGWWGLWMRWLDTRAVVETALVKSKSSSSYWWIKYDFRSRPGSRPNWDQDQPRGIKRVDAGSRPSRDQDRGVLILTWTRPSQSWLQPCCIDVKWLVVCAWTWYCRLWSNQAPVSCAKSKGFSLIRLKRLTSGHASSSGKCLGSRS